MDRSSRRDFLRGLGLGAAALAAPRLARAQADSKKPNIIFFLVDDMGWMDTTVNGSRYYETPNMERLAKKSMLFTDAYTASPLCSPTRASIMTGQYPARVGITTAVGHRPPLEPGASRYPEKAAPFRKMIYANSRRFVRPEEYTIAEALRDGGYKTAHIGKWHMGLNPEHWPEAQGFEFSFHGAPDPGPPSYFSPYGFKAGTVTDGPEGEYIADRVTDEALKFIEANKAGPFYLNLWHYSVHGPWGHKKEITERFVNKKDPRGKQANPIMASMLKSMDESLGRVLDKLDELGIADNTIIIFFSDNGGNAHSNSAKDHKLARIKPGHKRWPMIEDWKKYAGDLPPTNNDPLREGKGWIYEGGTRVPMMVCWPGVVKPETKCSEVVSSVDMYPTMLDMAGLRPKPGQVLDGEDITPLLKQTGTLKREAIFCYFPHGGPTRPPGAYVRQDDWKLIRWFETSEYFPEPLELYNLKKDIGETKNLAKEMPDKVKELNALIDKHLKETGAAVPKRNPAYDPKAIALGRWVPKGCDVTLEGGTLKVAPTGKMFFIANASLRDVKHTGAVVVRFRCRSTAAGSGRIQFRTAAQKEFPKKGQAVPFDLPAGDQWQEVTVALPVKGRLIHFRIWPGVTTGAVEFDWIRLCTPDGGVVKEWNFEMPR